MSRNCQQGRIHNGGCQLRNAPLRQKLVHHIARKGEQTTKGDGVVIFERALSLQTAEVRLPVQRSREAKDGV